MQSSNPLKRTLGIAVTLIAIAALGALAYVYRERLNLGLTFLIDETGSKTAAAAFVVLALFAVVCLVLWMVFPFLVFVGLKDLRRRTSDLDQSTKLCAQHLAELARNREAHQDQAVRR